MTLSLRGVRPRTIRLIHLGVTCAAAIVLACTADKVMAPGIPELSIAPNGGNTQTGVVGTQLPNPIVVQVTGVSPVNAQIVNFVVTMGGGSVFANVVSSWRPSSGPWANMDGIAENRWTLGTTAGPQTVEARLVNPLNGATLTQATFQATALAGPATLIKVAAGGQQTGVAGTAVATRPAVRVTDQYGNPIAGVPVTFAVASGGGSITGPATVNSGPDGVATVGGWTLATTAGSNTLTATKAGLTGSPVTFTALGGSGAAAQLVRVTGDGQSAMVGTPVATGPVVRAVDANGNAVAGVAVTFTVTGGGGSLDGAGSVMTLTDGTGAAGVDWTLGTTVGANTLRATSLGLSGSPSIFSATGTVGPAAQIAAYAGSNQTAAAGSVVGTPPAVRVTDQYGNPITTGVAVTFAVATGGGSITGSATVNTGPAGIAAVAGWTLGATAGTNTLTATNAALTGSPVTFSALGGSGAAAQLVRVTGDGQSAIVGAQVATAPVVRAVDANGNGVVGVAVTFTVTAGGGSLQGVGSLTTLTDATGAAAVNWTLGRTVGPNTLQATALGLQGSPLIFGATALVGPPAQILIAAGNNQRALLNAAVGIAPAVVVSDQYGNPAPNIGVTFVVTSGGGSVTGSNPLTNPSGVATVGGWTLGPATGANTLTATASGSGIAGNPVTFTATGFCDCWTTKASMLAPGYALSATGINGILYAVGGDGGGFLLSSLEAYDPASNTWAAKASMPTARSALGSTVINGTLYAVGGFSYGGVPLTTLEAYDPVSNTWTTKAPMPTGRWALGIAAINGILYAVGGDGGGFLLSTLEAYDPVSNTWTTKAPMPTARGYLSVTAIGGKLYAVGGYNAAYLATVEVYDPTTNTWTTKTSMPTARYVLGGDAINGILYAVGGSNGAVLATVEAYDPATNTWTTKTSMPTARYYLGVAAMSGILYTVGGYNNGPFATVEAYQP